MKNKIERFKVGDRIRCDYGEAKIVFIDDRNYHLLRDDKGQGGGILLKDDYRSYLYPLGSMNRMTLIKRGGRLDKKIIKYGELVISLGRFVRNKVSGSVGMVESYKYNSRVVFCCVRLFRN